nr:retrovirus-related Pol polyprotein from transposon TNT 1-94 [Tanacetum cinerariifolium]
MNEMIRNNLTVATMQVNVQFLQQLQPEWSRYVTIVKQQHKLDEVSYHKLFDILKQYQKEVNELCAERLARNANPLALVATAQQIKTHTTKHQSKEIAKPITPPSESASEEDSDPEQAQKDKDIQKNLALITKYFKRIYKPTNNNLRTSSNSRNKNLDTSPWVRDSAYHKEKMLLCKQAEKGVSLQVEQYDWLADTDEEIDEQELEAHYSYMAKIQENDQNNVESDDERVALANLKLDTEFEMYKAFNDRTVDYEKLELDSDHFACVTKMLNDVNARTKKPNVLPIRTRKPKGHANKSVATPHKKKVASKSTTQKPKSYYRICTNHMTGNLKLLCNFVEKYMGTVRFGNDQFAPILGYGDLVQVNIMINRVYYVEGLNHNLFSVGQFCDADLDVAFWKSTCFIRDLQGNDLLTGNHGSDLYTISLQESTSSTSLCLMAKALPTQAWLWHQRLSHLNFDYIDLLSKKDVVIGLPKLKYDKVQLYSSCEVSKEKKSSFKSKVVPSSKGRLNLLHMDLCGPMRVASINGKKYILVIVDDYSRYTWTLFLRSKDETPE